MSVLEQGLAMVETGFRTNSPALIDAGFAMLTDLCTAN